MHPKSVGFVPRTLLSVPASAGVRANAATRTSGEIEAKDYWDSLSVRQEAWALRKMGFARMGCITGEPRRSPFGLAD